MIYRLLIFINFLKIKLYFTNRWIRSVELTVNGVDLIRKILNKESFGLTSPLITLASGAKMGKTESSAIALNKDLFSSYEYWQFWRNTDDRDVKKF